MPVNRTQTEAPCLPCQRFVNPIALVSESQTMEADSKISGSMLLRFIAYSLS